MDKQTLSNYGWVVIVTLILAVMLALATPFGTYIGDGVVSVANGFVGTSTEATNEDNINKLSDKWENKLNFDPLNPKGMIPDDGQYIRGATITYGAPGLKVHQYLDLYQMENATIYESGVDFPKEPQKNDVYIYDGYVYVYQRAFSTGSWNSCEGWSVLSNNKDNVTLKQFAYSVNGKPITNLNHTFNEHKVIDASNLKIPSTVTSINYMFHYCESLQKTPKLNEGIIIAQNAFSYCKSLNEKIVIPSTLTDVLGMFSECTSLTKMPDFSKATKLTNINNLFSGCTLLSGTLTLNANPANHFDAIENTQISKIEGTTSLTLENLK